MLSTLLCTAPSSLSIDDTDIQHSRARLYSYPAMMPGNTASSSVTPARSNSVRSKYKFTMSGSRSVSTSVATFDATPTAESPTPSQSHRPFMKKRRQFSLQLPLPLSSASGGTRSLLRSGSLSGRVTVKDKGKPPAKDEDAVSLGIHGLKISPPTAFRHQFHLGKDMVSLTTSPIFFVRSPFVLFFSFLSTFHLQMTALFLFCFTRVALVYAACRALRAF